MSWIGDDGPTVWILATIITELDDSACFSVLGEEVASSNLSTLHDVVEAGHARPRRLAAG